jgi:hypothetical protein
MVGGDKIMGFAVSRRHSWRNSDNPRPASRVMDIVHARMLREHFLGEGLFSDPAWDILLELYAAEQTEQRVLVSRLRVAATLPSTAARQALDLLQSRGMVIQRMDPLNPHCAFAFLSRDTKQSMDAFFEAIGISTDLL